MPVIAPVTPFGLRLRQLADVLDELQSEGLSLRRAVEQTDEFERAEIAQALGFDDACDAVAMRQLALAVTALVQSQSQTDARLEPLLARAVASLERETETARHQRETESRVAAAGPATTRQALRTFGELGRTVLTAPWFVLPLGFALSQLTARCGGMP